MGRSGSEDRGGISHSRFFENLVLLAEVIARQLVEIGTRHTDDPGLTLAAVDSLAHQLTAIGFSVAGPDNVSGAGSSAVNRAARQPVQCNTRQNNNYDF